MSRARPSASRHPAAFTRRSGAALLIGAFLVGQVGSFAHEATATHSVCPEHGEQIHAELAPSAAVAVTAAAELRGSTADPRHEHDHCFVTLASRERLQPIVAVVVMASGPVEQAPAIAVDAPRASAIAGYRTAPKTSPPA